MAFNFAVVAAALVAAVVLLWRVTRPQRTSRVPSASKAHTTTKENQGDPYEDIEPRQQFDWSTTPPIKLRPYKPKFHLTMGLENCPLSELLEFDNTYIDRLHHRQQIMDENHDETIQCNPACEDAVLELYDWLLRTYLPKRYPTIFQLRSCTSNNPSEKTPTQPAPTILHNLATDTNIPLTPTTAAAALTQLSSTIDTDLLLLLPSSRSPDGSPIYHLEAFACCFPAGFRLRDKLSQPLAAIHAPVPRYGDKIGKSMDRFFARLERGRAVKRVNWGVTTDSRLFVLGGNHFYVDREGREGGGGDGVEAEIEAQRAAVVVDECRLRCERQTLHRLPKTGALLFAFKTYVYGLDEVRAEGGGLDLAEAIDGLTKGSVPEMDFYKRGVVWGEKVKEYLRS